MSFLLALTLIVSCGGVSLAAGGTQVSRMEIYKAVPVYVDGLLSLRGYAKGQYSFLSVSEVCELFDVDVSWQADKDRLTLNLPEVTLTGSRAEDFYTVDGRYLYSPEGWYIAGEELFLSCQTICHLFNLSGGIDSRRSRIDLGTENFCLLRGGDDYYEDNYSSDTLYWLSHIISGEARFEPLEGQIAVGNVVLNRVESPLYPNDIYDVIYEDNDSVQFEPTISGTIDDEPTQQAMIAAMICLEGYNVVGDCMFFYNPRSGVEWFDNSLEYHTTIGTHKFYRLK